MAETQTTVSNVDILKLKQQYEGKDMAECFALMQANFNKQIDEIRNDYSVLKNTVSNLESFAENITATVREINEKAIPNIEEKFEEIVSEECKERQRLEMWGRKWNMVVRGIPGDMREPARQTEKKVRECLVSVLKMDEEFAQNVLFTAVHRLPGGIDNKRNVIVRFSSLLDKEDVIQAARQLEKGSGYSFVHDLTQEASKLRASLLQKLRSLPDEERKKTKLVYLRDYPFVALKEFTKPRVEK